LPTAAKRGTDGPVTSAANPVAGRRRLRRFSGLLNLLLLLALGFSWARQGREHQPPQTGNHGPREAAPIGKDDLLPSRNQEQNEALNSPSPTPRSRLVAADLREFAGNLSAAGCAAGTICDLIRPESKRALQARTEAARFHTNLWLPGLQRAAHNRQVQAPVWQGEQEQLDLFAEVGCRELWREGEHEVAADRIVGIVAGFLPKDRQVALLTLVADRQRFEERWKEQSLSRVPATNRTDGFGGRRGG
jgi:hypothetical protein